MVCDHTEYETQLATLRNELEIARWTHRVEGTDDAIRQVLDDMTPEAREASAEAVSLRMQLTNA
jgi:hypothetical protein